MDCEDAAKDADGAEAEERDPAEQALPAVSDQDVEDGDGGEGEEDDLGVGDGFGLVVGDHGCDEVGLGEGCSTSSERCDGPGMEARVRKAGTAS